MASPTEGKSNLSFILNSPLNVVFSERPIPTLTNPRDVLVSVAFTGICGSDVHYWQHGAIGSFILKSPMCLGHESSGTIAAVGPSVTSLKVGDRVAVEPGTPCRHCEPCLSGHYNLCPDMRFAATPPYDGTLTGFYVTPDDFCYKLPDHMTLQEGALIEPLAVAVHVAKQAQITPGATVVVMGAGPVGLLCCAVARAFGASKVVSVDIQQARLDFAKDYAATHTFMPSRVAAETNATALIAAADLGEGADAVIDASGAEPSIQTSIHVVRRGGVYVQAGMGKPDVTFPILALCAKEITMRGSFRYGSGDYKLAVQLVAGGLVKVESLISKEVAFGEAEEAFEDVLKGRGIKVLIRGPNHEGDKKAEVQPEEEKSEVQQQPVAEKTEAVSEEKAEVQQQQEQPVAEKTEVVTEPEKVETTVAVDSAEDVELAAEAVEVKAAETTEPAPVPAAAEEAAATTEPVPVVEDVAPVEVGETTTAPPAEEVGVVAEPVVRAEAEAEQAPAAAAAAEVVVEKSEPESKTAEADADAEVVGRTSVAEAIHKIEGAAKGLETLG